MKGTASAVSVAFHSDEGAFHGSRSVAPYDVPRPEAAERVNQARKLDFIIRGYQLRHFVDIQEPTKRYEEVSAWFGLSTLLTIQKNLGAVRRRIKQTLDTKQATRERQRDLSTTTDSAVTAWDEPEVVAWINEYYLKPPDNDLSLAALDELDAGYQTVLRQKRAEEESIGLSTLRQLLSAPCTVYERDVAQDDGTIKDIGSLPAFPEAIQTLCQATRREEEERVACANAVFTNLWETVQPILDKADMPLDQCPVCGTPFSDTAKGSREAVALHIRSELASLRTYRAAWNALQAAQQALQVRLQDLRTTISTLEAALERADFQDELDAVQGYAASLAAWQDSEGAPASEGVTSVLGELEGRLQEEIRRKEEARGAHTWASALEKIDGLLELKSRFAYIQRFREELQALHDNLVEQEAFIAGRMRAYGQRVIDTLKTRVNEIFRAVHPDEEAPDVRLELNPDARRPELTLLLDFAPNRQGVPPSGYLSDSQIHTLALSLRLAAIQMFNSDVPLIVLDDVVTSYDADHRRAIAGMLATQFNAHQIILVTHDERFFAYLQEQLPQSKWIYKRIIQLDPNFGPRFHDHKVTDDLVSSRHAADQSAANEMRQAEEEWLTQISRDFGVDMRIRDVHRPYDYSRAELAAALAHFLKKRNLVPPEVPGVANRFLSTLQTGAIENFGSHFQDNPHGFGSVGDERVRWREFKAFRDSFHCPTCKRKRFKRPLDVNRPMCRHDTCETQFAFA